MQVPWKALERILLQVRKPGRYVGGEYNSVTKPWDTIPTRVCLAFPDIYDLGMSNLGLSIFYELLNDLPNVLAERAYLPWIDMVEALRNTSLPLYSLESRHAVADFDILAITLPYEFLFTNLLELLDLAGLPLRSTGRNTDHPLVIAGGHAVFNPEPVAPFIDAFVIGDGEDAFPELIREFEMLRDEPRDQQLRALARLSGVYVPRFYEVGYDADGQVSNIERLQANLALPVIARVTPQLPPPPTRLLVPTVGVAHNRAAIEIQRGCTRGCRFCQAGVITRPLRERPIDEVLDAIDAALGQTGFEEIGLLSLSASDYSQIGELVEQIDERFQGDRLSISLPSLRADTFSVGIADMVAGGRHSGFTFAPEAGTDNMRRVINKPITAQDLLTVAQDVFERGWRTIKLYFMIGLPGEELADVEGIAELAQAVRSVGRKVHGRRAQVNVSVNTFIPKPQTPLQWVPLCDLDAVEEKQALLRRRLRGAGLKLDYSDREATLLEATLARGDRRLADVIERAWALGARFDAWDDQRDMEAWYQAFSEHSLDPAFYASRPLDPVDILPWDVVSSGVSRRFLETEYRRSQRGELLDDCRHGCHGCGILATHGDLYAPSWCCPSPGTTTASP